MEKSRLERMYAAQTLQMEALIKLAEIADEHATQARKALMRIDRLTKRKSWREIYEIKPLITAHINAGMADSGWERVDSQWVVAGTKRKKG